MGLHDAFREPFHIFAFYVALNILIMLVLGALVVRARAKTQTATGDGGNPAMLGPLRAHANNAEYVPGVLLLMWALCPLGGSIWLLHGIGAPLTFGRLLHGIAVSRNPGPSLLRAVGMFLTWIAMIVGIVACLYLVFEPAA